MYFEIKKICCIGAGYVGGPTMSVIAKWCPHIKVNVVDKNPERIKDWNSNDLNDLPVFEPGLDKIIKEFRNQNLNFSTDIEKHISEADLIFISVNTPTKKKGIGAGKASDLRWIEESARQISKYAQGDTIVVEKSTLPVKTAKTIKQILEATNEETSKNFFVLSNPEFLAEGSAIDDLENPDRVLIGGENIFAIKALSEIYLKWVDKEKIITTNLWSSELSKLIANAFLAQRISSINTVSALCEKTGANIDEVSLAVGMDKRIGKEFLRSGPGFGGSCFKKDILNLIYISNFYGLNVVSSYWEQVLLINNWQQKRIYNEIVEHLFNTVSGKRICIFGFAFKANTNDTRESPAIQICKDLIEDGCYLTIYDPKVKDESIREDLKNCDNNWQVCEGPYKAAENCDAIVILTEWEEFNNLDYEILSKSMRAPSWIFDTRGIIDIDHAKSKGLNLWGLGKNNQ